MPTWIPTAPGPTPNPGCRSVKSEGSSKADIAMCRDPPPTLRERCESLQYRQELSERVKLFGAVCTIKAAMVLTAISERAGVDHADFVKLFKHCTENGFTSPTFSDACEELSALDAIEIFRTRYSQLMVKVKAAVDSATSLKVSEVIGSLPTALAEAA